MRRSESRELREPRNEKSLVQSRSLSADKPHLAGSSRCSHLDVLRRQRFKRQRAALAANGRKCAGTILLKRDEIFDGSRRQSDESKKHKHDENPLRNFKTETRKTQCRQCLMLKRAKDRAKLAFAGPAVGVLVDKEKAKEEKSPRVQSAPPARGKVVHPPPSAAGGHNDKGPVRRVQTKRAASVAVPAVAQREKSPISKSPPSGIKSPRLVLVQSNEQTLSLSESDEDVVHGQSAPRDLGSHSVLIADPEPLRRTINSSSAGRRTKGPLPVPPESDSDASDEYGQLETSHLAKMESIDLEATYFEVPILGDAGLDALESSTSVSEPKALEESKEQQEAEMDDLYIFGEESNEEETEDEDELDMMVVETSLKQNEPPTISVVRNQCAKCGVPALDLDDLFCDNCGHRYNEMITSEQKKEPRIAANVMRDMSLSVMERELSLAGDDESWLRTQQEDEYEKVDKSELSLLEELLDAQGVSPPPSDHAFSSVDFLDLVEQAQAVEEDVKKEKLAATLRSENQVADRWDSFQNWSLEIIDDLEANQNPADPDPEESIARLRPLMHEVALEAKKVLNAIRTLGATDICQIDVEAVVESINDTHLETMEYLKLLKLKRRQEQQDEAEREERERRKQRDREAQERIDSEARARQQQEELEETIAREKHEKQEAENAERNEEKKRIENEQADELARLEAEQIETEQEMQRLARERLKREAARDELRNQSLRAVPRMNGSDSDDDADEEEGRQSSSGNSRASSSPPRRTEEELRARMAAREAVRAQRKSKAPIKLDQSKEARIRARMAARENSKEGSK